MRILIHGINYAPDEIGIPKYTSEMAEWFAASGHEIRVITAPPYYPAWRIPQSYTGFRWRTDTLMGVRVTRCPIYVPAKQTGLRRLFHLLSFAVTSLPPALGIGISWRPDIVIGIAPALASAPIAWLCARLSGGKAWLHIQDFELDASYEMGLLSGGFTRRIAEAIERWILKRFDRVSTISPSMIRRLGRKGVSETAVRELRNWVDLATIKPTTETSPFREEWNIGPDDIMCLYSGNIGKKQGIEIIAGAARQLAAHENIKFVVCGQGAGLREFSKLAGTCSNLALKPLQPQDKLNALLNAADIHLLPQKAGAADIVLPSKLTGMLASGRPIVATASPDTDLAKEIAGAGLVSTPEDPDAFAQALLTLAQDSALRTTMGKVARQRAIENWDQTNILESAENDLTELCARSASGPRGML